MENLLLYFVKANGLIILFYLMYVLFLRKETFFTTNRWYLISGLVLSLILPLITFTKTIWMEPTPIPVVYEEVFYANNNAFESPIQETTLDWTLILTTVYTVISILLLMKITFELASFFNRIRKNEKQKETNYILIHSDTTENPFSFFHYIVINPNRFSKEEFQHILTHESIHVKQKHSIDVLLSKLFCAFFWANPIVWLYRKAMLQNLEFIADNETFQQIENKYKYQRTLLKVVTHQHDLSITNQFYQSLIKKRIVMLHTNQSHKRNAWKYGIILPLLVGFILLFQIETVAQVKENSKVTAYAVEVDYSHIVTSKTSDTEIKEIENAFKGDEFTLKISNLKRNKEGEIIEIKLEFSSKKNSKSKNIKIVKGDKPIQPIKIFIKEDKNEEKSVGFEEVSNLVTGKYISLDESIEADSNSEGYTIDNMVKNGKKVKMIINGKLQSENDKIKIPLDQELDVLKELDEKELKSKYNIDKKEGEIYYELLTKKEEDKIANTSWGISYQAGPPSTEKFIEDLAKDQNIDLSKSKIIFNGVEYKQSELNNIDYKDLKKINITINKSQNKTENDIIILETKNENLKPFEFKKISSDKPKPRVITIKNGDDVVVFDGDKIKFPGYPTHYLKQLKLELKGKILEDNIDFFKNYEFEKIKDLIIIEDEMSPKEKKRIKKIIIETK
ncbi:M56 family metallopeptidase [Flavobacterium sp. HXWNR69]|uniref:M56 family metallopeptidase n=1 Tax=Flavobacterium fragile TaxID=2949085 RepID=A0ABT0THM8_9FLAO|nr:M56 family metallopeptidase [Flavobacterium sp. HXWNR69]MCL9770086.1 M56 family metallopeptidase [Flavobacterium sp. HXWNR69]